MNQETIQKWAEGSLSAEDTKAVYRWMILCTSPKLPGLLQGILRERQERVSDQKLSEQGEFWHELTTRWSSLLHQGEAQWTQPGALPIAAALSPTTEPASAWLEGEEETSTIEVELPAGHVVSIIVTTDASDVEILCSRQTGAHLSFPLSTLTGPRPTLWIFTGSSLPTASSPTEELQALFDAPGKKLMALRWKP